MFRASSCPSSGATTSSVAASGLPPELGDSSAVGRGRVDQHVKLNPGLPRQKQRSKRTIFSLDLNLRKK
jgi:hypothetical protein